MLRFPAAARILRYAWAAPCTAAGLCLAAPALAFGASVCVVDGVIEVALDRLNVSGLPFNAITFGHLVIGSSEAQLCALRAHEQAHVRQYERWGALFFLAYPLASLWQLLTGRRPYIDNVFEVQARREAADEPRR